MVSTTTTHPTEYGNFKKLQDFEIEYAPVRVTKWRSEKTGLTVVVGGHQAPITNGHFAIASEIFDDTGRPHTLEHLIFLGSKEYPYKGVLDQLANRAGSDGTNAWTANDHTAYTIATAGTAGFLKMLPIYVDHILHPTITDAGFVTEVYHLNGAGEDGGVVYSEMQARENQSYDLMALEAQRTLYPMTSAYRSETGGLMSKLRVLTAQQIRDYHGQYYVPHNLCLIVDGAVELEALFEVLNNQVELLIEKHRATSNNQDYSPPSGWKRPFVETSTSNPLSIPKPVTKVVEFMEEDESMGEIAMTSLGPGPMEYELNLALKLLGKYLTSIATSPFNREFIEIPKPFCTSIGFGVDDRVNHNELSISAQDVPMKHLEAIGPMIQDKMKRIVVSEGIDMERMKMIITRDKRKLLNQMESQVSSTLAEVVIGDFLYGEVNGKDLPLAFQDLPQYTSLSKWSDKQWIELLDKYYVSQNWITIVGKPSAALSAKIEEDDKKRVAKRKEELGEEKLKELERKLKEAKAESDIPPPGDMITSFPCTDPKTLQWVPVETGINNAKGDNVKSDSGEVQKHLDNDGESLPYQAHFAHVKSNFVSISALFDTIDVPVHLKPYFSIFQSCLFSMGVTRSNGEVLTHEQVVDQLNDFTVSQYAYFSFRNTCSEVFVVDMQVEKGDYEKALEWMKDVIIGTTFTADRLKVILAKSLQELPYEKRDGNNVAASWLNKLVYDADKSTSEVTNLLSMLEFIPSMVKLIAENPDEVIKNLNAIKKQLLRPEIMRVSIRGDILGLEHPQSSLARSFLPVSSVTTQAYLNFRANQDRPGPKSIEEITMPAIEGSYSVHMAKGISGWDHPDLPALILSYTMISALESYLWKSIRGAGLAYSASISANTESGTVRFRVYRSPNAHAAYAEAKKILTGLSDGTIELQQSLVDGARSSLTYSYARASETVSAAAGTAFVNEVVKGVGKDHAQRMLETLPSIDLDQIRDAITKYLLPLFDPETCIGAVAVSTSKAEEVEKGFAGMGFEVDKKELPTLGDEEDGEEGEDGSDVEMGEEGSEAGSEK